MLRGGHCEAFVLQAKAFDLLATVKVNTILKDPCFALYYQVSLVPIAV